MHSDFWATEIKEDESGKKIIKIKDLAYNRGRGDGEWNFY